MQFEIGIVVSLILWFILLIFLIDLNLLKPLKNYGLSFLQHKMK